ncbi:hypothetical protein SDC9_181042 [bioreactor metagenome]|uniref:Uncharacterized protein n=1 Tax=bioreactor metagenome TaxID=1076179 RepID=A0A645HCP0_9ZZZZ
MFTDPATLNQAWLGENVTEVMARVLTPLLSPNGNSKPTDDADCLMLLTNWLVCC